MAPAIRLTRSSIESVIYWPGEREPKGGVVCLHGSEGGHAGWNDLSCAMLAANGFAAMAYRYTQRRPEEPSPDIDNVALDGAEAALANLRSEIGPTGGVGLYGTSRGAEHALLLAQLMAEDGSSNLPDAVAAHSPPDAIWAAYIAADFKPGHAWAGDPTRAAWSWRGSSERTRPGTLLRPELFPSPIFIAQGTEDKTWRAEMAHRLVSRMTEAGRAPEAHFFAGEGHVFGVDARNREWELLVRFFERHLRR